MAIRVSDNARGDGRPLIPAVEELTAIVAERLHDADGLGIPFGRICEHLTEDQDAAATVEDMLTHIRSLAAVAGQGEVRGLTAGQLNLLDNRVCEVIHDVVNQQLATPDTAYHSFARWANAVRRDHPIEVFTPNYDLLLEQAMEKMRAPYFDGFPGVRSPLFDASSVDDDRLPPHWARIWKLHGSINWYQNSAGDVFRGTTSEGDQRRVIHPSHLKHEESRRMPYLAMLDRLRKFLSQPTAAFVLCGYSFRDGHINDTIVQRLQYTRTSIVYALLFDDMQKYPQAEEIANRHPNLNVLARDSGIIGGRGVKWSKPVAGESPGDSVMGLRWDAGNEDGQNSRQRGECLLGDVGAFAQFLDSLRGGVEGSKSGGSSGS